jgi:hypothetical protein
MTLQISHTHTHTNTYIQNQPTSNAYRMLSPVGEIMGITLLRGHFQHLKNDLTKKIMRSYIISTNVLEGRHTTIFMPMNKNSLIHQSLCLKWSPQLKSFLASQWWRLTEVGLYLHIQWAYSRNAEYILFQVFITFIYRIATLRNSQNYGLTGNIPDLH